MKCHICGGEVKVATSDMPFKLEANRIVIFKNLPVLQCGQCGEYLIEDPVMARVEEMLDRIDASAELEIVRYAA
ncbi:MAG: type II toxin-antitoxin system MqsA family antitoxin [Candidatus Methylomirabilis oxygeniifera]|uniref:YgiT-type zinc finger domain-containing protein n=1 Tax=Methylomirabilis oxygeniifera TaxID=671143 RepID=D5MJ77_METO1|nr:MAG: type II toxin-antitoxin system MqsA family antitoxin [Candidatus Methylomirabilis oxyfera]CBE67442.1 conserved protein of unknown function [Candidatus Methylomirabilis oxyfera]